MNIETIINESNWDEMIEAVSEELQIEDEQVQKAVIDKISNASQEGMTYGEYLSVGKKYAEMWVD